jgi:hypothetical protein
VGSEMCISYSGEAAALEWTGFKAGANRREGSLLKRVGILRERRIMLRIVRCRAAGQAMEAS